MTFPAEPGSYALRLHLPEPARIAVGRLGTFDFPAGQYVYLGSAHGPGGLRGRLAHHLQSTVNPHWHIDYLRTHAAVQQVWWVLGQGTIECTWSHALMNLPGAFLPMPGFGASDCRMGCASHLVGLPEQVREEEITNALAKAIDAGNIDFVDKAGLDAFPLRPGTGLENRVK